MDQQSLPAWVFGLEAAAYHFVTEGLALFLMKPGIGQTAVNQTSVAAGAWGLSVGVLRTLGEHWPAIRTIYTAALALFYAAACCPWLVQINRPSLRGYCAFWGLYRVLELVDVWLGVESWQRAELWAREMEALLFVDLLQPIVICWSLLKDSQYWQGLYASPSHNLNEPLLGMWGISVGSEAATAMALTITDLSKRQPAAVPILPFGFLTIDTRTFFTGGSARVYVGKLKGKEPVAVKMLFCMTLTPETIYAFCEEAAVLRQLSHPNIVTCHGVCVMPPAICLVMEYCVKGSLFHFLHGDGSVCRTRKLTWDIKVRMIRDCIASIAYLHRHNLVHCDVKSLNFLVTEELRVKLADMGHCRNNEASPLRSEPNGAVWTAPEVLTSKSMHTRHSDVYSLAVVISEILTGIVPFDTLVHQGSDRLTLARFIADKGERPSLPINLPHRLHTLIQCCWTDVPCQRPEASFMLQQIDILIQELSVIHCTQFEIT